MKKFLLSLFALIAIGVNAQTEFTWNANDWTKDEQKDESGKIISSSITFSKDGFTMVAEKLTAQTAPTVVSTKISDDDYIYDVRIYAKGALTTSYSENITGLEFKISAQGKKRLADITPSTGTVTVDPTNFIVYWVGSAKSVTFTVGEKSTYGTESGKAGQFDFESVKLYKGGAKPDVSGSDLQPSGLAYSQGSKTITLGTDYELPTLSNPNNLPVTYSTTNEEIATIDANGNVTVVAAGSCTIKAHSDATSQFLEGNASYTLTVKAAAGGEGGDDTPKDEVSIPYEEAFSSTMGSFKIEDVSLGEGLSYVWKLDTSSKYMKASAYVNQMNIPAESWLVSPVIDLTSATTATLKFAQIINKFFGDVTSEATLWIKENGGSWKQLTITYPTPEGNWSKWTSENADQVLDITSYAGKKVVVGFKYVSSDNAAGTWEIKKFSVTGDAAGINAVVADSDNAPAYNLAGQRVAAGYKGTIIINGKKYIQK